MEDKAQENRIPDVTLGAKYTEEDEFEENLFRAHKSGRAYVLCRVGDPNKEMYVKVKTGRGKRRKNSGRSKAADRSKDATNRMFQEAVASIRDADRVSQVKNWLGASNSKDLEDCKKSRVIQVAARMGLI